MLKYFKQSSLSKVFGIFMSVCVITLLVVPQSLLAASSTVSTPTLIWPKAKDSTIYEQPVITGLTKNDTKVEVFIDGQLNGMAKVSEDKSGTASFSFVPSISLKSGEHTVSVVAIEKESNLKSLMSKETLFRIEDPFPAPTLFQLVVNNKTVSTKPFITGLAVNDSLIKVFIDKELNGQFMVENDKSGVANFSYQPFLDLDPNKAHLVYVTAVNAESKESSYSNVVGFFVKAPDMSTEEYTDPQVMGVSEASVATSIEAEQEITADENNEETTASDENDSNANTNTETDENGNSDSDQSALVWWVILAIIVIIIAVNLRGRGDKGDQGGLKGLEKLGGLENKPSDHSGQQTLLHKENSEKSEGGNNMPPPPPSK
jgi:hypothetical protein